MTHDYHETLPGYSASQVLHDGCWECESRAERDDHGLSNLDGGNFRAAWARAAAWNRTGLADIAHAEMPLLRALWGVQLHLERLGVPIGQFPTGSSLSEVST